MTGRINAIVFGVALAAAGCFGRQLVPTRSAVRTESAGSRSLGIALAGGFAFFAAVQALRVCCPQK